MSRALLTGYLSTAGDLLAARAVAHALRTRGYDVIVSPIHDFLLGHIEGARPWRCVDSSEVDIVVFVCGPIPKDDEVKAILAHFPTARPLSVGQSVESSSSGINHVFTGLFARDVDGRGTNPDLSFIAERRTRPRLGICLIDAQPEYGDRQLHAETAAVVDVVVRSLDAVTVRLDTRYPASRNSQAVRCEDAFLASLRGLDLVITNRLHGLVLALQQGIPVIAIDSIKGAGKITAQAALIGWPFCSPMDSTTAADIRTAVLHCLSNEARNLARRISDEAKATLEKSFAAFSAHMFPEAQPAKRKLITYTAVIGGTDAPPLPPADPQPETEFVCFTDHDPGFNAPGWRVEPLPWPRGRSARRTARRLKVMSHVLFGRGLTTAWFDATFSPLVPVPELVSRYMASVDMATVVHPWRNCVYAEGDECARLRNDDPAIIAAQMARYRSFGYPTNHGLAATGVLLRHHSEAICAFNETWWSEIDSFSLRDQLSYDFARWLHGIAAEYIPVDYYNNTLWSHRPHSAPPAW
jgi:Protein of unknown function (DUF616)/Polysaccharide pyruvyl transferase